ncbi:MAG: phosphotransferase [Ktedonobacteraceae bacterium]|nr:phosphotransferase [Ktedonobacteraceae bacterium]MBO0794517.1 phosphotransferase [Ktedonobacteraceae bacterium]
MNISNLWEAWPISGPWHLSPLLGGTNNMMWRADAADGQSYVLRLSPNLDHAPRMRYEAQLLQALEDKDPPFRLSVPLKATSGDILVSFEHEQGARMIATLSPLLPGTLHNQPPECHDLLSASHAALTLAWLDKALATLPDIQPPDGYIPLPTFGELALWHPLVSDPFAAVERLPADREQAKQLRAFLTEVLESVPGLYATLPQQVIHRDYDPGNILMDQQQVTAVLDFEFAGRDLRVLDLCVALSWWPVQLLGTGKEWELIDVFGTAYTRQMALSKEELLALPAVFRLRDATSLMHRTGRYLAGMETVDRMQRRVEHSLWREAWVSTHQQTLLDHALAWA